MSELARKLAVRASAYFNSPFGNVAEALGKKLSDSGLADLEARLEAAQKLINAIKVTNADLASALRETTERLEAAERERDEARERLEKIGRRVLGFSRTIDPAVCGSDVTLDWLDEIHRLTTEGEGGEDG
jgi:hypothetical protein